MATVRQPPNLPIRVPNSPLVRAAVVVVLALVVIAGVVRTVKWQSITSRLYGTDFVGGQAGIAQLHLPPGFSVSVCAAGLHAPRFMTVGPDGAFYVSDDKAGMVYRIAYTG